MVSNDHNRCHIFFDRVNEKYPTERYIQLDVLPYASFSSDDEHTFISPRAVPIPTDVLAQDQDKTWVRDKHDYTWSRGSTIWGPPSLILRIFHYNGEYKRQIHFGSSWSKFDKMARNFDLNNRELVRKYNAWLEYTMATYQTDGQGRVEDDEEEPWNLTEHVALRTFVNEFIRVEGLVAFATNLNWEKKVADFNVRSRQAGANPPWRDEASILKMFAWDPVIHKAFKAAREMARRVHGGETVGWDEQHPEGMVDVHEGLEDDRIDF
jgi:hypothetical protein